MSIGERILALRQKQKLSQADLASSLGISRQAVSKWESDKSSPDTIKLIQLSELLNTDVEYLATGRVTVSPPEEKIIVPDPQKVPQVIEKVVEVEKVVEKPVVKVYEKVVEKPVIQKVIRYKYRRNPLELFLFALGGFILGIVIGLFF